MMIDLMTPPISMTDWKCLHDSQWPPTWRAYHATLMKATRSRYETLATVLFVNISHNIHYCLLTIITENPDYNQDLSSGINLKKYYY